MESMDPHQIIVVSKKADVSDDVETQKHHYESEHSVSYQTRKAN
jgi:hypothetical protein